MKKKLFGLLACIMMFALAFGLVACGGNTDPETWTVTFVNGEQTVKTSSVEKGKPLAAADFPEDPTAPADKQFDGWYVGEEKLSVGFVPEADITANAKFSDVGGTPVDQYTVTFVVGNDTVKTVTVEAGKKPAANDLPSDPSKDHYTFDGWFDANGNEFDEDAVVNASATYTAKFTQEDYLVTFTQDGQDNKTVWVTKSSGKLSTADIPVPESVADAFFLGWYKDDVKAAADVEITADATFTAKFLTKADYNGIWYNDEKQCLIEFTQNGGIKCNILGSSQLSNVTFSAEDGSLTGKESSYSNSWTFKIDGNTMNATRSYWDSTEEDNVTATYTLTKAGAFALAGNYDNDAGSSSYLEIIDSGIVTHISTSVVYYGRLIAEGDGYKLDVYTSESAHFLVNVAVDAKGNLVFTGKEASASYRGIYIKNSTVGQKFSCGDANLYVHTVDTETVYVYSDKASDTNYYVTVSGTLVDGEIVTLTKEDEPSVTHLIKIVGSYSFVFPNKERGTYTSSGKDDLYLDGFGNATLGEEQPADYIIVGNKVIVGDKGYEIDTQNDTYTELTKETGDYVGKTFTNLDAKSYTVVFNGFGIIVEECANNGTYYGTYTIDGTTLTTVMEDPDKVSKIGSDTYTLKEENKVFCNSDESVIYTRDDYTLYSKLNDFVGANEGYWVKDGGNGEYIEIVIEGKAITKLDYNGKEIGSSFYDVRYDGSAVTLRSTNGLTTTTLTLTIEGDKLKAEGKMVEDKVDGEPVTTPIHDTYSSAEKPVTEKDAIAGGWKGSAFGTERTFWFDGFGKGFVLTGSSKSDFSYTIKNGEVTFETDYQFDYKLKLENGKLTGTVEDTEGGSPQPVELAPGTPDKFEGIWTSETDPWILTFTGYGYVHVKHTRYSTDVWAKYTVSDDEVTFEADSNDWTCTLKSDGATMTVQAIDMEYEYYANSDFTREGGSEQGGGR